MKKLSLLICFLVAMFASFSQNTWVQKTDFPTSGRGSGFSFAVGGNGYFGGGYNTYAHTDCWKYDPLKDTWTQVAAITGARYFAVSFVIGAYAYVGTGLYQNQFTTPYTSFYRYDPSNNSWKAVKSITKGVWCGTGFSSGGKGYVCGGYNGYNQVTDLWQYDPQKDTWTQKTDYPGSARGPCIVFNIGKNTYVGAGAGDPFSGSPSSDFYCYNSDSDTWHQTASYPYTVEHSSSFVINGKGYACGGYDGTQDVSDLYQYDPASDTWTQKASYGTAIARAAGFSIGSRGYVGISGGGSNTNEKFYVYESLARSIICDSIGKNALCMGTSDSVYFNVTNIYDTSNTFTVEISEDNFNTSTTVGSIKANNEGKYAAYIKIPTGLTVSYQYTFKVTSSSPSLSAVYPNNFSIQDKPSSNIVNALDSFCNGDSSFIYLIKRDNGTTLQWFKDGVNTGDTAITMVAKKTGKYHVLVSNQACSVASSDVSLKVNPAPVADIFSAKTTTCSPDSIQLISVNNNTGDIYTWWNNSNQINGATKSKLYAKQSGKYKLSITNIYDCNNTSTETQLTLNPAPDAQIATSKDTSCNGDSILLTSVNNSAGDVYEWWLNGNHINNAPYSTLQARQTGNYILKITNSYTCVDMSNSKNLTFLTSTKPSISLSGNLLIASTNISYQWYLDGNILVGETAQVITPKKNGFYTVMVQNSFGCTATSDPQNVTNISGINTTETTLGVSVFPNPTTNICTLILSNTNSKNYYINIINTLGQIIYTKSISENTMQLDLADYNSGIYMIQVRDKNNIVGEVKIIKQ